MKASLSAARATFEWRGERGYRPTHFRHTLAHNLIGPGADRLNSSTSHTPAAPIIKPAPTSTKGRRPAAFAIERGQGEPGNERALARRRRERSAHRFYVPLQATEGGASDHNPGHRYGQLDMRTPTDLLKKLRDERTTS